MSRRPVLSLGLAFVATTLLLAGCGAAHIVRLQQPAGGPASALGPVADCAESQGYAVSKHPDSVNIKIVDDAWVYFNKDVNGRLQMVLHFMGPHEKAKPTDPIAQDTRRKADGIWRCAQGRLSGTQLAAPAAPPAAPVAPVAPAAQPAPPAPAPAPQPAASAGSWPTRCAQLVACYADLTRLLCNGASSCKSEVKVKGSPSEADCRDMLRASNNLIAPLRMMRPGLKQPASCVVR